MSKEAVLSRLFSLPNKKRVSKTSKNQSRRTVSNMALTFSTLHPKPSRTNFKKHQTTQVSKLAAWDYQNLHRVPIPPLLPSLFQPVAACPGDAVAHGGDGGLSPCGPSLGPAPAWPGSTTWSRKLRPDSWRYLGGTSDG